MDYIILFGLQGVPQGPVETSDRIIPVKQGDTRRRRNFGFEKSAYRDIALFDQRQTMFVVLAIGGSDRQDQVQYA